MYLKIPGRPLEFRDDLWTSGTTFGIPGRPLESETTFGLPGRVKLTHSPHGTRTCDLQIRGSTLLAQYLHGGQLMLSN
jgi:hypothetical protein